MSKQERALATRRRIDPLTRQQRSARMARVRAIDTGPELLLRRLVFSLGYRYRLHGRDLPGRPDLVFPGRRSVIFVHGCLWHQHGCTNYRLPRTREWFWSQKLANNVLRDRQVLAVLREDHWRVLVVWECELRTDPVDIMWRVIRFLQ